MAGEQIAKDFVGVRPFRVGDCHAWQTGCVFVFDLEGGGVGYGGFLMGTHHSRAPAEAEARQLAALFELPVIVLKEGDSTWVE